MPNRILGRESETRPPLGAPRSGARDPQGPGRTLQRARAPRGQPLRGSPGKGGSGSAVSTSLARVPNKSFRSDRRASQSTPSPGPRLERNFQWAESFGRRGTGRGKVLPPSESRTNRRCPSGGRWLGCVVHSDLGPECGVGSRRGAAGRGRFPRARAARTVTATRARARPAAARPRGLHQPRTGARDRGRRRLGAGSW